MFDQIERTTLYPDRVIIGLKPNHGTSPIEIPIRMDRTRAELIVTSMDPAQQPTVPRIDKILV